jgi:hypothetical protein
MTGSTCQLCTVPSVASSASWSCSAWMMEESRDQTAERRESRRLFFVGFTRPKEELHILFTAPRPSPPSWKFRRECGLMRRGEFARVTTHGSNQLVGDQRLGFSALKPFYCVDGEAAQFPIVGESSQKRNIGRTAPVPDRPHAEVEDLVPRRKSDEAFLAVWVRQRLTADFRDFARKELANL